MCTSVLKPVMKLHSKSLAGKLEDKVEEDYGIRPFGTKHLKKAVGMDTNNKFYQEGGRGYRPPAPTGSDIYSAPPHALTLRNRKG